MTEKIVGRPRQTTHDEIRQVAIDLFIARGYAATSLAEVAAAAGISRTTLFAYFPAKRDLLWADHDAAVARARATVDEAPRGPVIDLLVAGILAASRYRIAEHAFFTLRWRVVRDDPELRAFASLRSDELLEIFVGAAVQREPSVDPELIENVARALMAVASRATELWSAQPTPSKDLDVFTAEKIAPLARALAPLLNP